MIRIRRLAAPPELIANQTAWTARWVTGPSDWIVRAARKVLQESLILQTHSKCAYCEAELAGGVEIEHYRDKVRYRELAFEWDNLFPSCGKCNRTKGNLDHRGLLLKPDTDNGEEHFFLDTEDGALEPYPGLSDVDKSRAEQTILRHDLNRGVLRQARKAVYTTAQRFLLTIGGATGLSPELRLEFVELLRPSKPYKLALRSALPKRLADVDRRMYHATD